MQNGNGQLPYRLSKALSHRTQQQILSQGIRKVIGQSQWRLGDREYRDLNADLLFGNLQEAEVQVLWLDMNKKSAIIREVVRPLFPNLTQLYLGDNNITSIQPLAGLKAGNLQKLYLNHNKIVSLRPLTKTVFPLLLELNLNGNFIEDETQLETCHFPLIETISLNYPSKNTRILGQPWFIKAEMSDKTTIKSGKSKLSSFSRQSFLLVLQGLGKSEEGSKSKPRDLFKTFQK